MHSSELMFPSIKILLPAEVQSIEQKIRDNYLLNAAIVVLTICSLFSCYYLWTLLCILAIKIMVEWRFTKSILNFFGNASLMKYFIVFQPIPLGFQSL